MRMPVRVSVDANLSAPRLPWSHPVRSGLSPCPRSATAPRGLDARPDGSFMPSIMEPLQPLCAPHSIRRVSGFPDPAGARSPAARDDARGEA
jgi:hypothetical protein